MGTSGILRRPAVPPPVRIRRDLFKLVAANDPTVDLYRRAIGVMKTRPLRDPTSWRYQAAIHDYPRDDGGTPATQAARAAATQVRKNDPRNPDPFATDDDYTAVGGPLPPDRGTFWRKCQHGSWFFISWHRMYLHFFEQIIVNIVTTQLGGASDWALPYWNYSASAAAALVPVPFQAEKMPDGTPNDLFAPRAMKPDGTTPLANAGLPFLDILPDGTPDPDKPDTNLNCLKATPFAGNFGGGVGFHHIDGSDGRLEFVPHNQIHRGLAGARGFMGPFSTAPLDPLFWLHHCNIDRLWEVWVQRQKMRGNVDRNPKVAGDDRNTAWLDVPFDFHDATGKVVSPRITSRDVMNTRVAPLSYEYEDTSDPFNNAPNDP